MADLSTENLSNIVKDALYVSVGLGVIGFQKAQVQRQELTKAVKGQLNEAKGRVDGLGDSSDELLGDARAQIQKLVDTAEGRFQQVEDRLVSIEDQIEAMLDQIEEKLPEQAREIVKQARETAKDARNQARDAAKDARSQVRSLVNRKAA